MVTHRRPGRVDPRVPAVLCSKEIIVTQSPTTNALTHSLRNVSGSGYTTCPGDDSSPGKPGITWKRTASETDPVVIRSQLPTSGLKR